MLNARTLSRLAVIMLAALLAACGEGGTTAAEGPGTDVDATGDEVAAGDGCENAAVLSLIEEASELEGEERESFLLEAAAAEDDGAVTLYTEMSDWEPVQEAFEERYEDLTLNVYRAPSDQVRQRILEEAAAGFQGADLLEIEALEMVILDNEGILAPSQSPFAEDVVEAGQFENFTADRFSYIVPMWNTELMSEDEIPQSLEDLTDARFEGRMALEDSDVYWFAVLVQHLQETQDMSEDEAIDLFREIAANSDITHGHTTTAELVAAGQYAISPNSYAHRAIALQEDDTPVAWLPVHVPVVAEVTAVSVLCSAANPAGALLLADFFLDPTGAQQVFLDVGRTPANAEKQAESFGDVDIEPIRGDVPTIVADYDRWSTLWDEVVRGTGA